MNAMAYPGNSALPAEVRERVLSTFRQVAQSYLRGNTQEASVGCEFILRIDGDFTPARALSAKLRDPAAPVDVEQLLASLPAAPSEGSPSASPLEAAQAALERRDFSRAMDLASQVLRSDLTNADAQRIATEAQERIEAEPFIRQFLASARQKLAAGNQSGARSDFEKARHLDHDHPDVTDFEKRLGQISAPEQAPPEPSGFGVPVIGAADDAPAGFDFGFGAEEPPAEPLPEPEISFGESEPSYTTTPSFASFDEAQTGEPPDEPAPAGGFSFDFGSASAPEAPPAEVQPPPGAPEGFGDAFGGFDAGEPSSDSFVVPEAPTHKDQGSSDFGFTFEDDQIPPPPPPPATEDSEQFGSAFAAPGGEGQTFDFSTASVETSEEERQRIEQHLREGDEAYERAEYQNAIDIWSRIFLLDVTNDAASERIEKARRRKQEAEATIEGLMTDGSFALEAGDTETARAKFEEVLRIDPGHFGARDGLEQVQGGGEARPLIPPPPPADDLADSLSGDTLAPAPPPPPRQGRTAAAAGSRAAARPASRRPVLMVIAALLVLVIAAVAWLLLTRPESTTAEIDSGAQIARAERLAGRGDHEAAIQALLAVPAGDPNHVRALELIDEYRKQRAGSSEAGSQRPPAEVRAEQVALAQRAFEAGDYVAARGALSQAAQIQPLSPELQQMLNVSTQKVGMLDEPLAMFREERWEDAAAALEELRAQDPGHANVRTMLAGSHFNRGVTALRDGNTSAAASAFSDAMQVDPNDPQAERSRDLARRYDGREKDLLFQIYVKYLPLRTF